LLAGSLAANWFLFRQGQWYYRQLNALRLDPLGLSYYGTEASRAQSTGLGEKLVVLYGDSRAAQWPAPEVDSFAFVNRGIGNQTSAEVLHRFDDHVSPLRPDVVVVQVGINDLKTIPLSAFAERKEAIVANCQANIGQIVGLAADLDATVILTTVFPVGRVPLARRPFWSGDIALAVDEVNAYLRSLEGPRVIVLDAFAVLADADGRTQPAYSRDMLHLDAEGYTELNEELVRMLEILER
jgi:lysophospholipase L1-like esterase